MEHLLNIFLNILYKKARCLLTWKNKYGFWLHDEKKYSVEQNIYQLLT